MTENATPRPRGSGSIYQNGSSVWWIKFYSRGRAHRESSHSPDRKVAEKLLKRRLAEVETKTYIARTNVKISDERDGKPVGGTLISDLFAEYRQQGRKSLATAEWRWEKHLKPFFNRLPADDLNTDLVQRYCAKREEEKASGPSINRELALLKRAFHLGMRCTPPKVRACPVMPTYKESDGRKGFLEDAQYTLLARECSKVGLWLRALLTTAYSFAFRKGELLSLRVKQIDLANGTIRLEAGMTKNGEGRIVKLTREVATLLTACVIGKKPDDFVFTRPDKKRKDGTLAKGGPVEGFRKVWESVCCSSGVGKHVCRVCYDEAKREAKESGEQIVIPSPIGATGLCPDCGRTCKKGSQRKYVGLIFHDLRRSGVRNLRRLGVQESIAMRISGHKTRAVFERYNIVDEADLADAASRLDAKQNAAAVEVNRDFGHDSGTIAANCTKNAAHAQTERQAAVLTN
ncbi:MAG: tyrosine-type recombinase/integrase [Terriglobales bacterium]